ncbi:MAG: peroxide stress protein YaaA, partial [Rhizorhabdus sp.]
MILLLSPAKSLDYESALPDLTPTRPRFADEALTLAQAASKLGPKKLSKLMSISDKLAKLNAARYADFAGQEERPALYAFSGDVY